jgi:hypothetical protein
MRVYSVTPIHVGPEELARRQARYDALAPDGLTVTLTDLGPEAPRALEDTRRPRRQREACHRDHEKGPDRLRRADARLRPRPGRGAADG